MLGYSPVPSTNDRSIAIAAPRTRARRLLLKQKSSDSKYTSKTQVASQREESYESERGELSKFLREQRLANRHVQNLEARVRFAHAHAGSVRPAGVRY